MKDLKVLMINGSPRQNGNTALALKEMEKEFQKIGIASETIQIGALNVRGCIACGYCSDHGRCTFDDIVNEIAPKFEAADGLVAASPVYYASANSTLLSLMTRLFYSTNFRKAMKVGAAVTIARRAGTTASFDEINKFFSIAEMPIASSRYWNDVFGRAPGEGEGDEEGLRNMRILARNMGFLMKSIALGKEEFGIPELETGPMTSFIR